MATPVDPPTSTIRVREALQHAILDGGLKPGERLRAEALAQRFGTSRTPVREALLLLEAEGLVEVEPHRGAVVRAFDHADLLDLYEVRALLEPRAAAWAATRVGDDVLAQLTELCELAEARGGADQGALDDQIAWNELFHRLILEAAGSPRLTVAMRAVAGIPRVFRSVFWRSETQRAESLLCHRRLVEAMHAHDAALAEAVMAMHIRSARAFLEAVIRGEQ